MNLVIYRNKNHEDESALFDLDSGEKLLHGDEYHDGITERIRGYLEALERFDIYKVDDVEYEWIGDKHENFKLLGFYIN